MPTLILDTTDPQRKDNQTKKKVRQPIKHTKTFSGCWTCRERHVKCDEGKPTCNRCQKAGVECQGYGIKLVWSDPNTKEREQNIRRAIGMPSIYDSGSTFMSIDVEETLDSLDRVSIAEADDAFIALSLGPFSVFNINPRDSCTSATECDNSIDPKCVEKPVSLDFMTFEISDESTELIEEELEDDMEEVISSTLVESRISAPPLKTTTVSRGSNMSNMVRNMVRNSTHNRIQISRHLDLLPRRQDQRELIHHWTNFVCWHLLPVDLPSNPFRSVFTPMALEGLHTPSSTSNGSIALFHALCAASAFSRSQLLQNDSKILTLAAKHYQLAIVHLRHSLSDLTTSQLLLTGTNDTTNSNAEVSVLQRTSILATITMFSAMDMITGRFSEWRTHLQGGASWLATVNSAVWQHDRSSSMVYQGYLAIAALSNINLPSNLDADNEDLFLDSPHYMLDRFFGLTRPILRHIVVMNSLVRQISSAAATGDQTTASAAAVALKLDRLEAQLYEQTPDTLDLSDLTPTEATLARHHAYVFYYASLVFFARAVRRLPPESLQIQSLVECAVARLEEIEMLGGDGVGCTLVWPPLVVASECLSEELQGRMLAWYRLKRRHGFMNLEMSKDIAKELWRRRKELAEQGLAGVVDIQWQDVLKDLNMDIVLA
ncbi:hypothetical protein LTR84_003185 [Exophiala bonariae]|uniref:Zn(2)-C6 fungal-type domain-containing protein n=1 Tax=Exophiala bonariae TaxID=1690606 RepID=A0AAV9N8E3_9EURO|nr:hypothetical protein LTR84_003185 [Exophiala bonariae]